VPYDPLRDLAPVAQCAVYQYVLVTRRDAPYRTIGELVAAAKAKPGGLAYGSTGIGGGNHLAAELFGLATQTRFNHIPYKGSAPALTDLLAGQVEMMFDNLGVSRQHVVSGKLKLLAVCSEMRVASLPDVPALAEILPGFEAVAWFGIVAPPKTPIPIAEKISAAVAEALKLPDVRKRLADLSAEAIGSTPAQMAAFMKKDAERWRGVIRSAGVKAD
jgi:tripartite-type tricarboxylate transporter receptor subunit TctC